VARNPETQPKRTNISQEAAMFVQHLILTALARSNFVEPDRMKAAARSGAGRVS
jgi:hypothetical protein